MTAGESSAIFFLGISLDTIIGMVLGMIASPLLMKAIKVIRHRRKMDRLFKEVAQIRHQGIDDIVSDGSSDKVA